MQLSHAELARDAALWFVAFVCLHFICRWLSAVCSTTFSTLSAPDKAYWAASAVSTANALIVASVAINAFCFTEPGFFVLSNDLYRMQPHVPLWAGFFLGYLAADLLATIVHWKSWSGVEANAVHHSLAIVAYWQIVTGGFGHFHALTGWLLESTTPLVNQRWFFAKAGWDGTLIYKLNGLMVVLMWLVLRILVYGWGLTQRATFQVAELDTFRTVTIYTVFVGGWALQWMWGYKLFRGLLKALGIAGNTGTKPVRASE